MRYSFTLLSLLISCIAFSQRADSLTVTRWIPAPAPFYKQKGIVKMEMYETTKGYNYTGSYAKFDTAGHVIEWMRDIPFLGGSSLHKETYKYDNLGLVIVATTWKDRITETEVLHRDYDVLNRPLQEYVIQYGDTNYVRHWQYDKFSRLAVEYGSTVAIANDVYVAAGWTEYFYDTLGRLSRTIAHSSYRAPEKTYASDSAIAARYNGPMQIDSSDVTTMMDYVYTGNKIERYGKSPMVFSKAPIVFTLDSVGRVISADMPPSPVVDKTRHTYTYTYGDDGLMTRCVQKDTLGTQVTTRTFVFEYFKKGEKHKRKPHSDAAVPEQY